ncbi:MAG: hypothetical protein WBB05_25140 [Mycolicibacterium fortuitum]
MAVGRIPGVEDDVRQEALIAKAASEMSRLMTWTKAERAVRGADVDGDAPGGRPVWK